MIPGSTQVPSVASQFSKLNGVLGLLFIIFFPTKSGVEFRFFSLEAGHSHAITLWRAFWHTHAYHRVA